MLRNKTSAPEFTLPDENSHPHSLEELHGGRMRYW